MISAGIAQREADARSCPAGIGVQHRDHDRHVGAADRDDQQRAEHQRDDGDEPEVDRTARTDQTEDEEHQRQAERDIDDVTRRQDDRRAAHAAGELGERDHRAGEGQRADGDAERHFDEAGADDLLGHRIENAEGFRRIERAGGNQHRGHADQRVEGRDQFGHRGHRHALGDDRADAATDGDTEDHQDPAEPIGRRMRGQRGAHGDDHAGHTEEIALAAGRRAGQPAQRQDEEDARDEIEQCGEIGVHRAALTSFSSGTSQACAA